MHPGGACGGVHRKRGCFSALLMVRMHGEVGALLETGIARHSVANRPRATIGKPVQAQSCSLSVPRTTTWHGHKATAGSLSGFSSMSTTRSIDTVMICLRGW